MKIKSERVYENISVWVEGRNDCASMKVVYHEGFSHCDPQIASFELKIQEAKKLIETLQEQVVILEQRLNMPFEDDCYE